MAACRGCSMKCLLTHGKRGNSSPVVGSFFKIMIDERFSETLFIPPKTARSLTSLVNGNIRIEDMNGGQWTVKLSAVGCDLAFERGWHAFYSAHGLELGDFLIFHHISTSHFVVQILDKTGGEKMNYPPATPNVPNKRAKTSRVSEDEDSRSSDDPKEITSIIRSSEERSPEAYHCHSTDDVPKKRANASRVFTDSDSASPGERSLEAHRCDSTRENNEERQNFEDPCCMIIRDIDFTPGAHERSLLDLSEFEMCKAKPVCGINDHSMQDAGCSGGAERMLQEKGPSVEEKFAAVGSPMDVSYANENNGGRKVGSSNHREIPEQSITKGRPFTDAVNAIDQKMEHMYSPKFKAQPSTFGDQGSNVKLPKREHKESNPGDLGEIVGRFKKERLEFNPGGFRKIKNGHKESSPEHFGKEQSVSWGLHGDRASVPFPAPGIVKTEPFGFAEPPSLHSITCLVSSDNATYLELPTGLSSLASRERERREMTKIVLLRDPSGRLWPIFYHEKKGLARMNVLAHGWQSFRQANRIQNGAECAFGLEDESKDIYRVHVVHK